MSDEYTFAEALAALQERIRQLWQQIHDSVVVPLRRWFNSIDWRRLTRALRRISAQMGAHKSCGGNSRIRMVQAKRARLGLPMDGKTPGLNRRLSYALATWNARIR